MIINKIFNGVKAYFSILCAYILLLFRILSASFMVQHVVLTLRYLFIKDINYYNKISFYRRPLKVFTYTTLYSVKFSKIFDLWVFYLARIFFYYVTWDMRNILVRKWPNRINPHIRLIPIKTRAGINQVVYPLFVMVP